MIPQPHMMALAPLDSWFKLLRRHSSLISPRFWPRTAAALLISAGSTIVTAPERAIFDLWINRRGQEHSTPAPLFVIGFYRSGTTHLHYLLSCDPNLFTPRWRHVAAPQGFIASWEVLRWCLMVPFMGTTRPVDGLAFGPDEPAEDDFALSNWKLTSYLVGRMLLPAAYPVYEPFLEFDRLGEEPKREWRDVMKSFAAKMALIARARRLLFKSPSHTAHVPLLLELFPDARFIHISRNPRDVVRSNIGMNRVFEQFYHLGEAVDPGLQEKRICDEYNRSERSYLAARRKLPKNRFAETRYEDLIADPIAELRRTYSTLDLDFSSEFESRARRYLFSIRDYQRPVNAPLAREQIRRIDADLGWIVQEFGHDRPPSPSVAVSAPSPRFEPSGWLALMASIVIVAIWFLTAAESGNAHLSVVWLFGVMVGITASRLYPSLLAGAIAAVAAFAAEAVALTLAESAARPGLHFALHPMISGAHPLWTILGVLSAFRLGSRRSP